MIIFESQVKCCKFFLGEVAGGSFFTLSTVKLRRCCHIDVTADEGCVCTVHWVSFTTAPPPPLLWKHPCFAVVNAAISPLTSYYCQRTQCGTVTACPTQIFQHLTLETHHQQQLFPSLHSSVFYQISSPMALDLRDTLHDTQMKVLLNNQRVSDYTEGRT
jgi:hypothetical protein